MVKRRPRDNLRVSLIDKMVLWGGKSRKKTVPVRVRKELGIYGLCTGLGGTSSSVFSLPPCLSQTV